MSALELGIVAVAAITAAGLSVLYRSRYAGLGHRTYDAGAAWTRAGIYFCICWAIAAMCGTVTFVLSTPLHLAHLSDVWWWAGFAACTGVIVVGYWVIWARMTLRFARKLHLGAQIGFGIFWGITTGMLFTSMYLVATWITSNKIGVYLIALTMVSVWQALMHDLFWDVWVSPEHDTPRSIKLKVVCTHIPNMVCCMAFMVWTADPVIFIGLQTLALVGASVAQRLPVPWDSSPTVAPLTAPGLFGLPHAVGYVSDDPDPYRTQRVTVST